MLKILTYEGARNRETSLIHTIMIVYVLSSQSSSIERDDKSSIEISIPHTRSKLP